MRIDIPSTHTYKKLAFLSWISLLNSFEKNVLLRNLFFFYFLNINLIHLNVESLNIFNSLIYFYIITKSQKDLTIMNTFAEITVKNFQSETL